MDAGPLDADTLRLVWKGGMRRVADFEIHDASLDGVVASIDERIDSRTARFSLGRGEALRRHIFELRDARGVVKAVARANRALPRMSGVVLGDDGSELAAIRQRHIGDWFPVDIAGSAGTFQLTRPEKRDEVELVHLDGRSLAKARPVGAGDAWRLRFREYQLEFQAEAGSVVRLIALASVPIIHGAYIAPRQ
jgi:hypothetical protein